MKTLLPIFLLSLVSSLSYSQITIGIDDLPSIGDTIYRNNSDTIGKSFFPGGDSENAVWDVSWLSGKTPELAEFTDPKDHQFKDSLGEANIIQKADPVDFFVKKDATGFNALGAIADPDIFPDNPVVYFDQPINFLPTPFTFKDKNFSSGDGNFYYNSSNLFVDYYVKISRDMEVVNYGKLKMHDGNSYDVLMVDLYEVWDSKRGTSFNGSDTVYVDEITRTYYYEFYTKGYGVPMVRAERDSITDSIIAIEFVDFPQFVRNKETSQLAQLNVYPNPSQKEFNVELPSASRQLELFDISGQVLLNENVLGGRSHTINGVKPGVYLLKIYDGHGKMLAYERLIAH